MAGLRKVLLINQTGRRVFSGNAGKYNELARLFVNDRDMEVVNPRELVHPPDMLPHFESDVTLDADLASHSSGSHPTHLSDQHYRAHSKYSQAVVAAALEKEALPVVFANPHEFTLGPYGALLERFPNLQLPTADTHIDFACDVFSPAGFLRYAIGKELVDPLAIQLFGPQDFSYEDMQGRQRRLMVNEEFIGRFPAWIMDIIFADRQGQLPEMEPEKLFSALKTTAKLAQPDRWNDATIGLELSQRNRINPFFYNGQLIWQRIYLHEKGVWLDLEHPGEIYDYAGKPVFCSLDTDVSAGMDRDLEAVVRCFTKSLQTGELVGMHIAEAETPLTKWSAKQIYEVVRMVLR
ncbi:MAG: hypothetical protein HQ596_01210 [Candidatus Saganbacteria bacterium]|nr:hypothetical protein [Candidatus Saganbacteria bacterium]